MQIKYLNKLNIHTLEVFKNSIGTIIVNVLGIIIGIGLSIFLGRKLGPEGLGIINLSNRIIQILLIVSLFGMRQVIVKEVAISYSKKKWQHVGNVLYTSYIICGSISLVLSIIIIISSPWICDHIFHEPQLKWPLIIGTIVLPPQIFSNIYSSSLNGCNKIWQSSLVEKLSPSITFLILILLWLCNIAISVNLVAIIYAISRTIVFLSMLIYWKTIYKYNFNNSFQKNMIKAAKPLFFATFSTIIISNVDSIILASFEDASYVGLYTVASRLALFTSIFLTIITPAISPKMAILYEKGEKKELENMIQQITRILGIIAFFFLFFFIIFGKFMLGIWGEEFKSAYYMLIILSTGQFINITSGPSGFLLIMSGHENIQGKITTSFSIINVLLCVILIYYYGAIGAAWATAITIASANITRIICAKIIVGINVISIKKIQ